MIDGKELLGGICEGIEGITLGLTNHRAGVLGHMMEDRSSS